MLMRLFNRADYDSGCSRVDAVTLVARASVKGSALRCQCDLNDNGGPVCPLFPDVFFSPWIRSTKLAER